VILTLAGLVSLSAEHHGRSFVEGEHPHDPG